MGSVNGAFQGGSHLSELAGILHKSKVKENSELKYQLLQNNNNRQILNGRQIIKYQ